MNIKEFYDSIGGSYGDVLSRLMNDAIIEKFVFKFKDTQTLDNLENAIKAKDYEKAFFEVHTLKGVALNLGFKKLGESSSILTEMLRGELSKTAKDDEVLNAYQKIEENYLEIISKIRN